MESNKDQKPINRDQRRNKNRIEIKQTRIRSSSFVLPYHQKDVINFFRTRWQNQVPDSMVPNSTFWRRIRIKNQSRETNSQPIKLQTASCAGQKAVTTMLRPYGFLKTMPHGWRQWRNSINGQVGGNHFWSIVVLPLRGSRANYRRDQLIFWQQWADIYDETGL